MDNFVLSEYHYERAYGESIAGIEPGVHAGRQQRQLPLRSEPVLDELDDAEQFDLCVHYSKQRHVAVCSRCTEQSLSYWSGAGVHGRGSIEPVHLHVEWGWDGHGQGAGQQLRQARESVSRVDLYGGRTGDMPCSKRQHRLAGSTAAGEPGQDVITNPEERHSKNGTDR